MKPIVGIYKIENLNNHQIYIGQSVNIYKRFKQHLRGGYYEKAQYIDMALCEEGYENFKFSILEQCCLKELDYREQYYIQFYNCIFPYGYNKTSGGFANHEVFIKTNCKLITELIFDLKNNKLSIKDLVIKYDLDASTIYRINKGIIHYREEEIYPLRIVKDTHIKKNNYCIDYGIQISSLSAKRCVKCNCIYQRKVVRPSKEELILLLKEYNGNFTAVGRLFHLSANAIKSWCKIYNISFYSKDYKEKIDYITKPYKKKVAQIDKNTNEVIQVFESAAEAGRYLNKKNSHIIEVCQGKYKTAYGYKWVYI